MYLLGSFKRQLSKSWKRQKQEKVQSSEAVLQLLPVLPLLGPPELPPSAGHAATRCGGAGRSGTSRRHLITSRQCFLAVLAAWLCRSGGGRGRSRRGQWTPTRGRLDPRPTRLVTGNSGSRGRRQLWLLCPAAAPLPRTLRMLSLTEPYTRPAPTAENLRTCVAGKAAGELLCGQTPSRAQGGARSPLRAARMASHLCQRAGAAVRVHRAAASATAATCAAGTSLNWLWAVASALRPPEPRTSSLRVKVFTEADVSLGACAGAQLQVYEVGWQS